MYRVRLMYIYIFFFKLSLDEHTHVIQNIEKNWYGVIVNSETIGIKCVIIVLNKIWCQFWSLSRPKFTQTNKGAYTWTPVSLGYSNIIHTPLRQVHVSQFKAIVTLCITRNSVKYVASFVALAGLNSYIYTIK